MNRSPSDHVRVAPGVALFATPRALLARGPRRWRRITLSSRHAERSLVERLALGAMSVQGADESAVRALMEAGILLAAPVAGERGGTPRFPEHVLVGAPDDARLGARLEARVRERACSLVLWIDERGLVAAADEGEAGACPLCAWLFDAALARYVTPDGDLAECPRAFGDREAFLARAADLVAEASDLPQGNAWILESPTGPVVSRPFPPHPSCPCIERAPIPRAAPPPAEWGALASARHACVWPVDAGDARAAARVVYRRSRVPWSTRADAYGVALGAGSNARVAALAEAIERFAMLHAPPAARDERSEALEVPALDARSVRELLYRDSDYAIPGFRFEPYDPDASQDWCVATSLVGAQRRLVPASLVGRARAGRRSLVDATSNGYAAHTDPDRAIVAALLELVERDAILIDGYAPRGALGYLEEVGGPDGAHTFLMTQDIDLPVVLSVALSADGALRCGSAGALTLDDAIRRAHAELGVALTGSARSRAPRPLDDPRLRCEPDDHLAVLRGELAIASLDGLLARAHPTKVGAIRDRWAPAADPKGALVGALAQAGLEPWVIDRSLPELFGADWYVVRVLVPGLVELSWGMVYRRLASPRVAARIAAGAALSSRPHPLA